jgi:hypothetical protein
MIKFFRKIRQKLLTENKISKYLLYAIGEIVLVVVGILIALQLNNLNDERKTQDIKKVYYKQLLNDFQKDLEYIDETTQWLDSNKMKIASYKDIFKKPNLTTSEIIENIANLNWSNRDVSFQSNTTSTLQNTGDIKLMPLHLRDKLINLKRFQEGVASDSNKNNQQVIEMWNYASRLCGSSNLFFERLQNQPKFLEYVLEENRQIEIVLALESAQDSKEASEKNSHMRLEETRILINQLTTLIKKELKK